MVTLKAMEFTNAHLVSTYTDLGRWISHLTATLCEYTGDLCTDLYDHMNHYINNYIIRYCKAKRNRIFLIECRTCGSAVYGKYPDGDTVSADRSIEALQFFCGSPSMQASKPEPSLQSRILMPS